MLLGVHCQRPLSARRSANALGYPHNTIKVPNKLHVVSRATTSSSSSHQAGVAGTTSNDDIVEVLRAAFPSQQPSKRNVSQPQAAQSMALQHTGLLGSARQPAARIKHSSSRRSSSSNRDGEGPHQDSSSASEQQSTPGTVTQGDISKVTQRKGPFSDLLQALEQDKQQPAASKFAVNTHVAVATADDMNVAATSRLRAPTPAPSAAAAQHTSHHRTGKAQRTQQQQQQQQQQHHHRAPPSVMATAAADQPLPPWLQQQRQAAATADPGQRRKQYKPVDKGGVLLPGGPAWSALRRHIMQAGSISELPTLHQQLVIVEGDQDQRAVARAVNTAVYVCDGTRVLKPHVLSELQMLPQLGYELVVLTDPDERGRELRLYLDDVIGPVVHAFVPEPAAAAAVDGLVHQAGNRGIEHVVPAGVQQALAHAKMSYGKGRQVWSIERLQQMQLANAFDASASAAKGKGGAADRRRLLCAMLGLGRCTAAQLVVVLNRFFDEADVEPLVARL